MRYFIFSVLMLTACKMHSQEDFEKINKEIESLTTHEAVQNYWITIYADDQNNNGAGTEPHDENIDAVNLYKVAALIEKFDYPINDKYVYPAPVVPWVVWTHCNYPEIKEYTIPVILKARELNQLPEGMYPNYFVGGLLLDNYGLDMEFDPDFKKGELDIIALATKHFEGMQYTVDIKKLRKKIQKQMEVYNMKVNKILGTWTIRQFDSNKVFKIIQLDDYNWYLSTQSNSNPEILLRVTANKDIKIFEPVQGFGLFYFVIDNNGNLLLRNRKDETVKTIKRN